jgi:uncharacterized protein (TIGR01777 family)
LHRTIHAFKMHSAANSQPIVLSGGSGMIGSNLRHELTRRKSPIIQLVRNEPVAEGQLYWNPTQDPAIPQTARLEGSLAAIHLSGASVAGHRWTEAYKREITASRVESTRALAMSLAKLRNPPSVLLVASATGIYGNRGDELLTEDAAPGEGFLADVCRQWEAAAQPAVDAGIRVVHLRFGVVLGPGHGALEKMLPFFRLGLGGKLGNGRQWMSWISLADAIAAILFALDTPSLGGPVNLASPNPVTNAEFAHALGRQLRRPAILPVPAFAIRLAFGQMADEALLGSIRAVPARLQSAGFPFAHPTIEEALAVALAPAQVAP